MIDWDSMTRKFLLGERINPPSLRSYIQSLNEILKHINPPSLREKRNVEIAIEHLRGINRHTRKLEEKVSLLEEKLKVLEEGKK